MSTSRYSSKAHQRDRQALFSMEDMSKAPSPSSTPTPIPSSIHISSPYENSESKQRWQPSFSNIVGGGGYSAEAQEMAQLESQSEETVTIMKDKIGALRDLSIAMGTEINKSKKSLTELGDNMGMSSERIKYNMSRMRRFVEKSGIGWKVWMGFSIIILWCFIWVWLF